MKRSSHTEKQTVAILGEQNAQAKTADICRSKHSLARLFHSFRLNVMVTPQKSAFLLPNNEGGSFRSRTWFAEHPRKRSDGGSTAPAVVGELEAFRFVC